MDNRYEVYQKVFSAVNSQRISPFAAKISQADWDFIVKEWPDVYFQTQLIQPRGWIARLLHREAKVIKFSANPNWIEYIRKEWADEKYLLFDGYKISVEVI